MAIDTRDFSLPLYGVPRVAISDTEVVTNDCSLPLYGVPLVNVELGVSIVTMSASGGAIAGGTAPTTRYLNKSVTMAGGAIAGGSAPCVQVKNEAASGGAVAGASAPAKMLRVETVGGGAVAGGTGAHTTLRVETIGGGAVAGGTAPVEWVALANVQYETMTGGAIAGGSASILTLKVETATGGAIAGGVAPSTWIPVQIVSETMSGGAVAGGSAPSVKIADMVVSGGAVAGGEAPYLGTNFAEIVVVGEGGAVVGGTAPFTRISKPFVIAGGAVAGGTADVHMRYTPVIPSIPHWHKGVAPVETPVWGLVAQANKWGYLNNPEWDHSDTIVNYDSNPAAEPIVWPFVPQPDKPHYNEGTSISEPGYVNPVWTNPNQRVDNTPVTPKKHDPWCGYWTKDYDGNYIPPIPPPVDDLYIVHDAPLGGAGADCDEVLKHTKLLGAIIEVSEPACPFGIAVDNTYTYVTVKSSGKITKRRKSDLSLVTQRTGITVQAIHTASGSVAWYTTNGALHEISKSDLSTIRSITGLNCDPVEQYTYLAYDLTCDEDYLYVADTWNYRVAVLDRATLAYVTEFGRSRYWASSPYGVAYAGGNLYIGDGANNKMYKAGTDYVKTVSIGHPNGGLASEGYATYANRMVVDGSYVYTAQYETVVKRNISDLSYVSELSVVYPQDIFIDGDNLYVMDLGVGNGQVQRYNKNTFAYIDGSGDIFGYGYGMTVDASYIYVIDQDGGVTGSLRVYRLNKADYSIVDYYEDLDWDYSDNPHGLAVDGTYVYIVDGDFIRRINKATMAYVDSFEATGGYIEQMAIVGDGTAYLADYGNRAIQLMDLSDGSITSTSPLTEGDPNFWMDNACGIACDETYIYVSDRDLDKLRIYDKATFAFVDEFATEPGALNIAVDDLYIYVASFNGPPHDHITVYSKVAPYTQIAQSVENYATSCDTMYIYQV